MISSKHPKMLKTETFYITLPETNIIVPDNNMVGRRDSFLLGWHNFLAGANCLLVSGRVHFLLH